jgi:hypothetical protein
VPTALKRKHPEPPEEAREEINYTWRVREVNHGTT